MKPDTHSFSAYPRMSETDEASVNIFTEKFTAAPAYFGSSYRHSIRLHLCRATAPHPASRVSLHNSFTPRQKSAPRPGCPVVCGSAFRKHSLDGRLLPVSQARLVLLVTLRREDVDPGIACHTSARGRLLLSSSGTGYRFPMCPRNCQVRMRNNSMPDDGLKCL